MCLSKTHKSVLLLQHCVDVLVRFKMKASLGKDNVLAYIPGDVPICYLKHLIFT